MLFAIRHIERFFKRLYRLETPHKAHDFLIYEPLTTAQTTIENRGLQGALYVIDRGNKEDLDVGIYLEEKVVKTLSNFRGWKKTEWSLEQLQAFCVASEEISHFHFLIYQVSRGASVSQFQLELQGEVDKFLATLFALRSGSLSQEFDNLYDRLFFQFKLAEQLTEAKKTRYEEANRYARQYVLHLRKFLRNRYKLPEVIKELRTFYRLCPSEKIRRVQS